MSFYIVTTTKFYCECIEHFTYGASQSNWLCNIDVGDTIFLSQFSYKSQDLFGPFRVTKRLFYDNSIIYPEQKYFYRVRFEPIGQIKEVNNLANVDCHYIWAKNKLDRNNHFSSESDMEAYIVMSLKNADNKESEYVKDLLGNNSANCLINSKVYN